MILISVKLIISPRHPLCTKCNNRFDVKFIIMIFWFFEKKKTFKMEIENVGYVKKGLCLFCSHHKLNNHCSIQFNHFQFIRNFQNKKKNRLSTKQI